MSEAVGTIDVEAAPAQFGRRLAAARESGGLSVADVARQLRLSPSQVEAIEAGAYERLPGTVFARGFVRNYARLMNLDPEVLLAGAEQRLRSGAEREPEVPRSVNIPFPTGREFNWRRYVIVAPVLLLVLVIIFEVYREDASDVTVKSGPVMLPPPQAVGREPEAAASAVPQVATATEAEVKPALTLDATALSGQPAVESPAPPAVMAAVERKRGEHLIKLVFERQSWVEIHDRAGRVIFSRLNAAGTEHEVSGEPPLKLVVGNARGVRLTYDGRPVDLAPHTNVAVARLTLE